MGALFHPVGSSPAWVYWARRGAVVLGLVLVVALGIFLFRPPEDAPLAAAPSTTTPAASGATTTPELSTSPTPSASPTRTGPLACDASTASLTLAGYQKVKQDGRQPFRLAISNTGGQPCILELTPSRFSLTVTSGTDRIWSTEDCEKWVPDHKQTLKPKQAYEFSVVWSVKRSAPGCKTPKSLPGPGTYVAAAAFAADAKARQVFVVTKAA